MKHGKQNYLDLVPVKNSALTWKKGADGIVIVDIKHTGVYDKIAQKIFSVPKVSHIKLDKYGSFVWLLIDGKHSIYEIGQDVSRHFGKDVEPLYERLAKYFSILKNNSFIKIVKENSK